MARCQAVNRYYRTHNATPPPKKTTTPTMAQTNPQQQRDTNLTPLQILPAMLHAVVSVLLVSSSLRTD